MKAMEKSAGHEVERLMAEAEEVPVLKAQIAEMEVQLAAEIQDAAGKMAKLQQEAATFEFEAVQVPELWSKLAEMEAELQNSRGVNHQVLTAMEATSASHARELAEMKEAYDASLNALCRKHGHAEAEVQRLKAQLEEVPELRNKIAELEAMEKSAGHEVERLMAEAEEVPVLKAQIAEMEVQHAAEIQDAAGTMAELRHEIEMPRTEAAEVANLGLAGPSNQGSVSMSAPSETPLPTLLTGESPGCGRRRRPSQTLKECGDRLCCTLQAHAGSLWKEEHPAARSFGLSGEAKALLQASSRQVAELVEQSEGDAKELLGQYRREFGHDPEKGDQLRIFSLRLGRQLPYQAAAKAVAWAKVK
eukprot:s165_g28.t1